MQTRRTCFSFLNANRPSISDTFSLGTRDLDVVSTLIFRGDGAFHHGTANRWHQGRRRRMSTYRSPSPAVTHDSFGREWLVPAAAPELPADLDITRPIDVGAPQRCLSKHTVVNGE